jgi:hypothetical protein
MSIDDWKKGHDAGFFYARSTCIDLVMKGTEAPVQTDTLRALQTDRLRIARDIAIGNKDLEKLVESYLFGFKEMK